MGFKKVNKVNMKTSLRKAFRAWFVENPVGTFTCTLETYSHLWFLYIRSDSRDDVFAVSDIISRDTAMTLAENAELLIKQWQIEQHEKETHDV